MAKQRSKTPPKDRMREKAIDMPAQEIPIKNARLFDPSAFLMRAGLGRAIVTLNKGQMVFSQADPADAVFYIQRGHVRLSVISSSGKEATIGLLGAGDFLG